MSIVIKQQMNNMWTIKHWRFLKVSISNGILKENVNQIILYKTNFAFFVIYFGLLSIFHPSVLEDIFDIQARVSPGVPPKIAVH